MKKKDINRLSRRELVDIVCQMAEEDGSAETKTDLNAVKEEKKKLDQRSEKMRTVRRIVSILLVAAAAAVLLSTFFFPVIQVSGDSMEPSLHDGDLLLLRKTTQCERGTLCCIAWQNKLLLKRVIGMPGDEIEIDSAGNVFINDTLLDEPYLTEKSLGECDITFPYVVPKDKLFILGDRRDTSIDSRNAAIGCVSSEQLVGKVLFRIWSTG